MYFLLVSSPNVARQLDGNVAAMGIFQDRADAGRQLGQRLAHLRGQEAVILGVPRGGVPVAFEVAVALDAPLDVIVVRKLGVPSQPELAMGAIGEDGAYALERSVLSAARVKREELQSVEGRERAILKDRVARFRTGRDRVDLRGRIAVVVDDGIATGSTARVACRIARNLGAARVILAVPVAAADILARLTEPDEVVCLATPPRLTAVGYHYRDFSPTGDDEVVWLLDAAAERLRNASSTADDRARTQPPGASRDGLPQPAGPCPGGHPPVRRTWNIGGGGDSRRGLVRRVPAARVGRAGNRGFGPWRAVLNQRPDAGPLNV